MSTYTKYGAAPAVPAFGLFPAGATSPNAFPSLHQQSPRDTHSMYAQFSSPASSAGAPSAQHSSSGQGSLSKRFSTRNLFQQRRPQWRRPVQQPRRRLPRRPQSTPSHSSANTPILSTPSPLDLSRNFADLRELDAVLSASMSSITTKISTLTEMIEQGKGQQEERLWLLMEIAEEATRLRLGGEDKIRVACQAADNLRSHSGHLRTLTEHIPGFDANTLNRRTTYPHVATRSFMPVSTTAPRTRRGGGLLQGAADPSPVKGKRGVRDDDLDHRSPRKERVVATAPRPRAGGRKKIERAPSPTESLLSVTSHVPPQSNARASGTTSRGANGPPPKRSRTTATRGTSNPPNEYYANNGGHDQPNGHTPSATGNARREAFNVPPSSSSHPSLVPYGQNGHVPHATPFDLHARNGHTPVPGAGDWNPPHPQTLEGPGMPVARNHAANLAGSGPSAASSLDNAPPEAGDGEADGDDKPYCFCQRVSFGQMIACDDSSFPYRVYWTDHTAGWALVLRRMQDKTKREARWSRRQAESIRQSKGMNIIVCNWLPATCILFL
ncbi:Chromatin modification-related protein [Mycena venus]|uniref:Chromatin modification-related protein n=1 Tax=Mycena venus TaxID=2733690 RepID=A0A8H7CTB6_9AGAR|nr:Chromatin modification-related protein [Mycena venus]